MGEDFGSAIGHRVRRPILLLTAALCVVAFAGTQVAFAKPQKRVPPVVIAQLQALTTALDGVGNALWQGWQQERPQLQTLATLCQQIQSLAQSGVPADWTNYDKYVGVFKSAVPGVIQVQVQFANLERQIFAYLIRGVEYRLPDSNQGYSLRGQINHALDRTDMASRSWRNAVDQFSTTVDAAAAHNCGSVNDSSLNDHVVFAHRTTLESVRSLRALIKDLRRVKFLR